MRPNGHLRISNNGLELIKKWEGYKRKLPDGSCRAYLDTIANPPIWTIGYGCTEGVKEGEVWTHAKAIAKLREEVLEHEESVKKVITVPLNQNQYDALVSFSYNYGIERATTLKKHVNNEDWQDAGNCLVNIYGVVRGKGVINGLVNRRKDERKLLWTLPKEEVIEASRKLSTLARIRNFIVSLLPAGSLAEYLGFLEPVKEYIVDNRYWFIMGTILTLWMFMKWFEQKSIEDHNNGNYTPSGADKFTEDNKVNADDSEDASVEAAVPEVDTEPGSPSSGDGQVSGAMAPSSS